MDLSECIRFATENPVTYIASVEGDQPRVRAFAMWFADNTGFYYHTGTPKSVCQQLRKNPKVELCFYAPGAQGAGRMMRVTGMVEFLRDKSLEERAIQGPALGKGSYEIRTGGCTARDVPDCPW